MKFTTIAEAFNHYRNSSIKELEQRATEIKNAINTDANADVEAFNIELAGIKQAKENTEQRSAQNNTGYNVITGMNTAKKVFTADTVLDSPEYRNAFYKVMLDQKLTESEQEAYKAGREVAEKRASTFNQTSNSAAILPTTTLNEIIKKARTEGGLLAECRAFNMPTAISVPVGTPSTAAAWHSEGAAVESTNAVVATVSFSAYEIVKVFSISAKVRAMSIAAFEAYLVEELTACVMDCLNAAIINGTGSAQGTGLDTITWTDGTNAIEVANGTAIDYENVVDLVALLKRGYSAGAKFAMSNSTLYKTFYGMVDTNGRPIFITDPKADNVGKILGFEVVVDDNIADDVIYFGNYSKYFGYNLADGISIEASTQSSFRNALIDYRAVAIADCKPLVSEAFVKLYVAAE